MTQYLVLIYESEESWATADEATYGANSRRTRRLREKNGASLRGGNALESTMTATSLRKNASGDIVATDGPFAETKEALGRYYVIEADDLDAALAMLSKCRQLWWRGSSPDSRDELTNSGDDQRSAVFGRGERPPTRVGVRPASTMRITATLTSRRKCVQTPSRRTRLVEPTGNPGEPGAWLTTVRVDEPSTSVVDVTSRFARRTLITDAEMLTETHGGNRG